MHQTDRVSRRNVFSRIALALAGAGGISRLATAANRVRARAPAALRAPFRRVVAGTSATGKSIIVSDGPVPRAAQWTFTADELAQSPYLRGISGNELWLFNSVPTDATRSTDPLLGALPDDDRPTPGGIIARIHRFEAGTNYPMHQTPTVDLIIIIAGEMELGLEQGATTVRQGDVIVQNRTQHAWRVVGDQPCVFVAVMVDAATALTNASKPA